MDGSGCVDVKRSSIPMQQGGYVIYGVGHQHAGAIGSTLYAQVMLNNCNHILNIGIYTILLSIVT